MTLPLICEVAPVWWTRERLRWRKSTMAKTRPPYRPEFRRQIVELVRAGRSPDELARQFEPTAQSIRNWVAQAERDAGGGDHGLTTAERGRVARLRRENRQLRLEREILSKAAAGLLSVYEHDPTEGFRFVSEDPGRLSDRHHVPAAGCLPQRLLCMGEAAAVTACAGGRRTERADPDRPCGLARHLRGAARSCRA